MNTLQQQITSFTRAFHGLINEKNSSAVAREEKKQKIMLLAKQIFLIEGDEDFKNRTIRYIEEISAIKPGRKLISALATFENQIRVVPGEDFEHCGLIITINNQQTFAYATANDEDKPAVATKPAWINFAHELVHQLHYFKDTENKSSFASRQNILPAMDNLEEQHTISGFNPETLSSPFEPVDVLCENAFLIAFGLPHRIDHRSDSGQAFTASKDPQLLEENYYRWIQKALAQISELPLDKRNDQEFILDAIKDRPQMIKSISDELKENREFLLKALDVNVEILDGFSELCKDGPFMLSAYKVKAISAECINPELCKNKDFVLSALQLFGGRIRQSFIKKIDPSLLLLPEIQNQI
jgi:hypothetical protein